MVRQMMIASEGAAPIKRSDSPRLTNRSLKPQRKLLTTSSIDVDTAEDQSNQATIEHMNIILTNRGGGTAD
jgi:hypothetical protein